MVVIDQSQNCLLIIFNNYSKPLSVLLFVTHFDQENHATMFVDLDSATKRRWVKSIRSLPCCKCCRTTSR